MSLQTEIQAVQRTHPSWSFQESWDHLKTTRPSLFVQSSAETNRATAKAAPQREEKAREEFAKVECIARKLMERDRTLTFGRALQITRDCLPAVQREITDLLRQSVKAEEPIKGRTLLIRGSEGTYVD